MTALDDLNARKIDDGADRMEWLRARQGRITASMIGKMYLGGASKRRQILEESFQPPVEITGNKYIDRGHEREPVIAEWIHQNWDTISPNIALYHAVENRRHAATPDGIGVSRSGRLVLAEIKTSKHDLDPRESYFARTGYFEQMQWQMHVMDASATLFVWEQHDDDWEEGPTPLHPEPMWTWIQRDDGLIAELVALADLALAERDAMAVDLVGGQGEIGPVDPVLAELANRVLEARVAKQTADAQLKVPWAELQQAVEDREEFSSRAGRGLVTWSNREVMETVPDREAALAAKVDPLIAVDARAYATGADLLSDYEYAKEVWETHLAKFTKQVPKRIQKLTVTEPKPAPAADPEDFGEF